MKILNKIIIVLIFLLAGVMFFHSFTSINADIGRHLKVGYIIWQTGTVPKVNLLSFTAPEYPFVNHHWLSEVVFYKIYSLGNDWMTGLKAVMFFKIAILLAAYLILFSIVRKNNTKPKKPDCVGSIACKTTIHPTHAHKLTQDIIMR